MDELGTRLILVTPARFDPEEFLPRLEAAMDAGDVAAVILDLAEDSPEPWRRAAEALCPAVQARGAAFLVRDHLELVHEIGADGAHVVGDAAALAAAGEKLKPDLVVGAGDCTTRHAAMLRGEQDPDYVFLGRLDADEDRAASATLVEWWTELFRVPGVALATGSWETVESLARAGAEFLAFRDLVWTDSDGPAAAVRRASEAVALSRGVAA